MDGQRVIWAATRLALESSQKKNKRNGSTGIRLWKLFESSLHLFVGCLKAIHLYEQGLKNATSIKINDITLGFPHLPSNFDHLRVLHLTDLHLDGNPAIVPEIIRAVATLNYDLCVLTGDYRMETHGSVHASMELFRQVAEKINAPLGTYATLGNHDSYRMAAEIEKAGVQLLANETVRIEKDGQQIAVTGTDDVHYYFTDNAIDCMETSGGGFKIALVHSPEMYDVAAENNYSLYLCGHTHGGQVCLPGGRPVFKHLYNGSRYIKGVWRYGNLTGYTSEGCGTSGIPVRFNSHSEITLFTLTRDIG